MLPLAPLTSISSNAISQYAAVDRLERAIEVIQTTIEQDGGSLVVKMKVHNLPFALVLHKLTLSYPSRKLSPRRKSRISPNSWPRLAARTQRFRETRKRRPSKLRLPQRWRTHHRTKPAIICTRRGYMALGLHVARACRSNCTLSLEIAHVATRLIITSLSLALIWRTDSFLVSN